VVEIGRAHFGGFLAWVAWMALHITVLIGFRNRLAVLLSWIYSYVFFRRGSRLITRGAPGDLRRQSAVPPERRP
jgi:NADH dehydrogenase